MDSRGFVDGFGLIKRRFEVSWQNKCHIYESELKDNVTLPEWLTGSPAIRRLSGWALPASVRIAQVTTFLFLFLSRVDLEEISRVCLLHMRLLT